MIDVYHQAADSLAKQMSLIPPLPQSLFESQNSSSSRHASKLRATWLGHACYYVEFPGGLLVLFDPVLEERSGLYNMPG